jgi:hypothetical protein
MPDGSEVSYNANYDGSIPWNEVQILGARALQMTLRPGWVVMSTRWDRV